MRLRPATTSTVRPMMGILNAWIDFNADGDWLDAGEQIFVDAQLTAGVNSLSYQVPHAASAQWTYARFRFSTARGLTPYGWVQDGEVEDYRVEITIMEEDLDYGDAPNQNYQTLLGSDGARHVISSTLYLGAAIDAEPDGQPGWLALGDDNLNVDDEDGVIFVGPMMPGGIAMVDVTASSPGILNAWFDFNVNNDWLDAGEQIFIDVPLVAGVNHLSFAVPPQVAPQWTYVRFRFGTTRGLASYGWAPDGEVEDYRVEITIEEVDMDYGDAPDPTYPTLLGSDGARHVISPTIYLGMLIDAEPDGHPNIPATGDNLYGLADEDGVIFVGPVIPGVVAAVNVTASTSGTLNAWFDFNADGDWADAGEQIFTDEPLVAGVNLLTFPVPLQLAPQWTYARFRFSTIRGLPFYGWAPDGEVEDYHVEIIEPELGIDFGDAPDQNYQTLLASDGARHIILPMMHLGAAVDAEPDGQPNGGCNGLSARDTQCLARFQCRW